MFFCIQRDTGQRQILGLGFVLTGFLKILVFVNIKNWLMIMLDVYENVLIMGRILK